MVQGQVPTERPLTESEVQLRRSLARYQLVRPTIYALTTVLSIVAMWVPLRAIQPIVDALAGRETNVTLTVSITVAFTLILGGSAIAMWVKLQRQKAELIRLRARVEMYEEQAIAARGSGL